jgi:biopolymer transport protein TolR
MMAGGNQNGLMSEINVTPFVDVMLVLLIIFMVTAPMLVEGVNVDLPETTAAPLQSETENLIVSIDSAGRLFINNFEAEPDLFVDKMRKIVEARPDQSVYLRADKTVPYGVVVRVMGDLKAAGIEKLGMVTEPPVEEPPAKKQ